MTGRGDREQNGPETWAQSSVSFQSTVDIVDAPVSFEPPSELERSEVDMPDAPVNCLEADIFACAGVCNVAPLMVPLDAPVGTDVAHLEVVRIFQRRAFGWHLTWRDRIV